MGPHRVGGSSGPRVEQDDGTVAVRTHAVDRVTRDRLAGPAGSQSSSTTFQCTLR